MWIRRVVKVEIEDLGDPAWVLNRHVDEVWKCCSRRGPKVNALIGSKGHFSREQVVLVLSRGDISPVDIFAVGDGMLHVTLKSNGRRLITKLSGNDCPAINELYGRIRSIAPDRVVDDPDGDWPGPFAK